jgi:restriction endonuclease S subunit
MNQKLKDIVKIKSGVFAKGAANPDLFYVQSTDFDKQRNWNKTVSPVLTYSVKFLNHILNAGDVLFVAKGRDFFAITFDNKFYPAVASTTFLVLQVRSKDVLPEYISWFLNHPSTQKLIWKLAKGSAMPSISKSLLEQMEISIPTISKQNTILELYKLQLQEKKIHKQIGKLRQEYINEFTYKSIQ